MKAADKKRLTAFEMMAYRRMMRICWTEITEHRTDQSFLDELSPSHHFLTTIQRHKLKYFGHVVRTENLSTDILHSHVNGSRSLGKPKRCGSDDVKDWTGLLIPECISWLGTEQHRDPSYHHLWSSIFRYEEEPTEQNRLVNCELWQVLSESNKC